MTVREIETRWTDSAGGIDVAALRASLVGSRAAFCPMPGRVSFGGEIEYITDDGQWAGLRQDDGRLDEVPLRCIELPGFLYTRGPAVANHTPGPWHIGSVEAGQNIYIWSAGEEFLVGSASCEDVPHSEQEANARLIAAAPGLLDGCHAAIGAMAALKGEHPWLEEVQESIKAAVRKAIAAADGG